MSDNFKRIGSIFRKINNSPVLLIQLIAVAHLVHDIYTSFLAPMLPLLINKYSLSLTYAASLSVALRIPSLFNPLIGYLADKKGLKYFIVFPISLTAFCICLLGNAPNYFSLIILLLTAGISSSCFHVPAPVLLKNLTRKRLGASMSSFQIGGELSRTIGPLILVLAISLWDIDGLFRLMPIGFILSLILWLKLFKYSGTGQGMSNISEDNKYVQIIRFIRKNKYLLLAVLGILLVKSFTASIFAVFLPTYLIMKGSEFWFASVSLSIFFASAVVGVFFTGTLSDKVGRKKILIIFTSIAPFTMIFFLLSGGSLKILTIILLGFFSASTTPVILAYIQEKKFNYPAIVNGIYMTMNFLLGSIGVFLFGYISDRIGIDKALYVFVFLSLIVIPLVYLLPEINERDEQLI